MNRLLTIFAAAVVITMTGCDKNERFNPYQIPDSVLNDFIARNPGATLLSDEYHPYHDGIAQLKFTDSKGIEGIACYLHDAWMMTTKSFSKEDMIYQLPRNVARTYIGCAPDNEDYSSNNDYAMEISRAGIDFKQYEFMFYEPRQEESSGKTVYYKWNIVIDEEGDLVYLGHGMMNPTTLQRHSDISRPVEIARGKYPEATIAGAINEGGNILVFIKDEGHIKTVKIRNTIDWEWDETRYRMADDTTLPESALKDVDEYIAAHPGAKLTAIYHVEYKSGEYYGLQFGDDWNNTTIFSKID